MAKRQYDGEMLVKESPALPKGHPYTRRDQGGPRELAAHKSERMFNVLVRCDGRGGYHVSDRNGEGKISGSTINKRDPNRPLKPRHTELQLRDFDDSRYALEPTCLELKLIERERQLITHFRNLGEDDPYAATEIRLEAEEEIWEKAESMGINPSDYVDAELQGIDPKTMARKKKYTLKPMNPVNGKAKRGPGRPKKDEEK